jgi:hypothetical protein
MAKKHGEHTLEFLLGFNGRVHRYAGGYWVKFEITKGERERGQAARLSYSFTLHGPDNRRLVGFDNAHGIPAKGSRFKKRSKAMDHWHRTGVVAGQKARIFAAESDETVAPGAMPV